MEFRDFHSGASPFDKPKDYIYSEVTSYHLNKANQLYEVKNFDLAQKEFLGILACAKNKSDQDLILKCESFLNSINEKLSLKDKNRLDLINFTKNGGDLKEYFWDNFLTVAKDTEEYYYLMDKIVSYSMSHSYDYLEVMSSFDPLKYIIASGSIDLKKGLKPFMLFDLDSTLFDNSPRVYKIISEFIEEFSPTYPEEVQQLASIKREDIVWGIKENLKKLGLDSEDFMKEVFGFWYHRFFSNEYIIDLPLKGSVEFIDEVKKANIEIVYLTGRFESMREGTLRNLYEHNFPVADEVSSLIMKPSPKIPDHVFKHEAMEQVKLYGSMIAGFDNEPINVNIFKEHIPESSIFFLETNHSLDPPNLFSDIHSIKDFSFLPKG